MRSLFPLAVVIALTNSGASLASEDCQRPMAEWQSRDTVATHVTELGITPERLRIDDGCYEIRGQDADGNQVELNIDPATLAVLKLEVRFRSGADSSRYLPGARAQAGGPAKPEVAGPQRTPGTSMQTGTN